MITNLFAKVAKQIETCAQWFLTPLCSLFQGQDDDLAGGVEAEGDETAYACRDEEGLRALGIPTVELLTRHRHRAPAEKRELHLVGMAAQRQLGASVRDDLPSPGRRIVFEQQDEVILFDTL